MSCKICGENIPVTRVWYSYREKDRKYAQSTCNDCKRSKRLSVKRRSIKVVSDKIREYFKEKK